MSFRNETRALEIIWCLIPKIGCDFKNIQMLFGIIWMEETEEKMWPERWALQAGSPVQPVVASVPVERRRN